MKAVVTILLACFLVIIPTIAFGQEDPAKAVDPAAKVEPKEEAAKPAEAVKPAEAAKPAEALKPAEAAKVAEVKEAVKGMTAEQFKEKVSKLELAGIMASGADFVALIKTPDGASNTYKKGDVLKNDPEIVVKEIAKEKAVLTLKTIPAGMEKDFMYEMKMPSAPVEKK